MKTMKTLLTLTTLTMAGTISAFGQGDNCSDVIKASKVVSAEFRNRKEFQKHASNFCHEYNRTTNNTSSRSHGINYKFLSASMGKKNASYDDLAIRFCSADNTAEARSEVFDKYIEMIAPEAYESYNLCKHYSQDNGPRVIPFVWQDKKGINFSLMHDSQQPAVFQGIVSSIFECSTREGEIDLLGIKGQERQLSKNALNIVCNRKGVQCIAGKDSDPRCTKKFPMGTQSYTHYSGGNLALNLSSAQFNIPFKAFDGGAVIVEFERLQDRVENLETRNDELTAENKKLSDLIDGYVYRRWCDFTKQRKENQNYTNDEGYPVEVAVSTGIKGNTNFCSVRIYVNGNLAIENHNNNDKWSKHCSASITVPPRATYRVSADAYKNGHIVRWFELVRSCGTE